MKRILMLFGGVALLLGAAISPAAAKGTSLFATAKHLTVGVVLDVGGVDDKSFNHLAYIGLQKAQTKYKVKGFFVVSNAAAEYVPNLTNFAAHDNMAIGVGFNMEQAVLTVATQFPHKKFALVDGCPADANFVCHNQANVANLFFKEQESGYLVGVLTGLMEKGHYAGLHRNVVGAMGGVSIPPVNRYIAGYVAGVHKVDPRAKILLGYSQSFTNQGAGNLIGRAQIGNGAEVLFQVAGSSGLGYLHAAQQLGKYGIGVDADQGYLGKYILTSALKRVNVAVQLIIRDVVAGKFRGGDHLYNLKNNGTGFGKTSKAVPASVVSQVKHYEQLIKTGKIVPPAAIGPLG